MSGGTAGASGELHAGQALDALGAQELADKPVVLQDSDALEIGAKLTPGCLHRKASVVPEGRCLAALSALCHCAWFLSSDGLRPLRP